MPPAPLLPTAQQGPAKERRTNMLCPKCGRGVESSAVICGSCDFILDASFLGDDIRDDESEARPGKGGLKPQPDFGEAFILGDGSGEMMSFEAGDTTMMAKESTQARFYVSGASKALMAPDAIPALKEGVDPARIRMTPFERHLLSFVDGKAHVDKLRKASGMEDLDVKTTLATLADKGVVFMAGRALADAPPRTPSAPRKRPIDELESPVGPTGAGPRPPLDAAPTTIHFDPSLLAKTQERTVAINVEELEAARHEMRAKAAALAKERSDLFEAPPRASTQALPARDLDSGKLGEVPITAPDPVETEPAHDGVAGKVAPAAPPAPDCPLEPQEVLPEDFSSVLSVATAQQEVDAKLLASTRAQLALDDTPSPPQPPIEPPEREHPAPTPEGVHGEVNVLQAAPAVAALSQEPAVPLEGAPALKPMPPPPPGTAPAPAVPPAAAAAPARPAPSEPQTQLPQVSHEQRAKAQKIFDQALKDVTAGNMSSARMNAKLAAIYDPSTTQYKDALRDWGNLALAQAAAGDPASKPKEVILFEKAQEAESIGDFKEAVKLLEKALAHRPNAAALHNRLAVVLATRLKEFDRAFACLERAIDLDPDNPAYKNNLGKVMVWHQAAVEAGRLQKKSGGLFSRKPDAGGKRKR